MTATTTTRKLEHAVTSLVGAAESIFRNPSEYGKRLRLEPQQVRIFNIAEFGYDIARFSGPPRFPDGKFYRSRFNALPWERQSGKTTTCSLLPGAMIISMPPPIWVGVYGPNDQAAMRLVKRTRAAMEMSRGRILDHVNKQTLSNHHIEMKNGNVMEAFNSSQSAIRGPSIDYAFIDEMAQIKDPDVVEGAIVPATRDKWNRFGRGILFGLSTPNKANANSIFRKWVNRAIKTMALYCHGCNTSFPVDDFVTQAIPRRAFTPLKLLPDGSTFRIPDIGPCPECEETGWDYIFKYYAVYPGLTPRFTAEQRKIEMEQLGNTRLARQEFLGEFHVDSGGIFTEEMLKAIQDKSLANITMPKERNRAARIYRVTAQDLGRLRDSTVFITLDQNYVDKTIKMINIEALPVGSSIKWKAIKNHTLRYLERYDPDKYIPDATGLGDPFVADVADMIRNNRKVRCGVFSNKTNRTGFVFDKQSKRDIIEHLEISTKMAAYRIPPESERGIERLVNEMLDFGYTFTGKNNMVYSAMKGHDDCVVALAMALWALKQRRFPRIKGENIRCV